MMRSAIRTLLSMAAVLAAIAASPAHAQAKAALVRSADEPGRVPYAQTILATCNGYNCIARTDIVPVGKRLVIEQLSGLARVTQSTQSFTNAEFASSTEPFNPSASVLYDFRMNLIAPPGANNSTYGWGFNAPVQAYVEAGNDAYIVMNLQAPGPVLAARVTFAGYLVDVTP